MVKIYLAARFGRREECKSIRTQLQSMGYEVTSSWLDLDYSARDSKEPTSAPPELRQQFAKQDIADILAADWFIMLSEEPDSTAGKRGGRHCEMGVALATGKRVVVIGPRENIFHFLPQVEVFPTFAEFCRQDQVLRGKI